MTIHYVSAAAKAAIQSRHSVALKGGTGFPPSREHGLSKEIAA